MLKRYIRARFDLSPAEYRVRWGLPGDYPMIPPAYSRRRRELALATWLGNDVRAKNVARAKAKR